MTEKQLIAQLLDRIDAESAERPDFEGLMTRAQAEKLIDAVLWMYGVRAGSTSSVYAAVALGEAVEPFLLRRSEDPAH